QQGDYWTNAGQITSGDPSSLHLIESYTYDFNTSKETGTTDPNGLSTTYQYDANLRPTISNLPSGATSTFGYVDNSQSSSLGLSYVDLDGNGVNVTRSIATSILRNGWGQVSQLIDENGGQVNFTFDSMGHLQSRTLPFPAGGQPG